ncbi:CaiB/BaiF CoA transferase family protein [Chloroflexota bacterium]
MTDTGSNRQCSNVLKGVKVLEFAWVIAAPLVGKYLADNGATVVRIESMKRPDLLRTSEPFKDKKSGVNRAGIYAFYGTNKYSLSLDLKHPQAMTVINKLVSWADIVTENFAPGKIGEMGMGYDRLKAIKEDIIMLQVSIQGQTGPDSRHPGYGILAVSLAGLTGLTGWPDRIPSTPVAGYSDVILPRFGAMMLIAALDYKRRTGKGQCIDMSQFEITQHFLAPTLLDYTVNKRDTTRQGNYSPVAVPHNAYRCQGDDRWCAISVATDEEWQALCQVIGQPDLPAKPGFATIIERKRNEPEIDRIVGEWTVNLSPEDVTNRMQAAGVPAGVVQNGQDLLADPQLARSLWLLNHNEIGPVHHLGQAFTLSRSQTEECRPAPCLGQDTEYVCTSILGMNDQEFMELLGNGLFE